MCECYELCCFWCSSQPCWLDQKKTFSKRLKPNRVSTLRVPSCFGVLMQDNSLHRSRFCDTTSTIFVIAYSVGGCSVTRWPRPGVPGLLVFLKRCCRKNKYIQFLRFAFFICISNVRWRKNCCPGPTANCHYPWIGMRSLRCGSSLAAQVISVAGIPRATETKRDTGMSIMCDFPSLFSFFYDEFLPSLKVKTG